VTQKKSTYKEVKNNNHEKIKVDYKRITQIIFHPRAVFVELETENKKAEWMTPLIVVCAILLLSSLLSVTSSTTASTTGAANSSSSASSFSTGGMGGMGGMPGGGPGGMGMQTTATTESNGTSEDAATASNDSSSTFLVKVLTMLGTIAGFLLTWLILGSLVNLFSITFGGQANTHMAMVFAAWSTIPIGVRGLMQLMYALATATSIKAVGLSGFISTTDTTWAIILEKLLAQIDIYLIWQVILLVIGISVMTKLNHRKPFLIALCSIVIILIIKSLLGLGLEKLSSLNVSSSMLNRLIR
jgi:hypothetical protein